MITPASNNLQQFSGATAATYATWVAVDDSLIGPEFNTVIYKSMRTVAMCARIEPQLPTSSVAAIVESWCGPDLTSAGRTAHTVAKSDKPLESHPVRESVEIAWCPRQVQDFTPHAADMTYDDSDLAGVAMSDRPAIHLWLTAGTPSASYRLIVTAIYEGFLTDLYQYRSPEMSPSSPVAASVAVNAIHQVPGLTSRFGDGIGKVAQLASKAASIVSSPAVMEALSVGRSVASLAGLVI
jgi:hypothetical protein